MPRRAPWPYPRWVAHRGAGLLAPENTLAALRLGQARGYRMAEVDVKLSADGLPFLLHDDDLLRTTDAAQRWEAHAGAPCACSWARLSQLDAGGWLGPAWAGEPLCSLNAAARFARANALALNLELKPCPGQATRTGQVVAQAAAALWAGASVPPLLSSFSPAALHAAQRSEPALPRALLLETLADDWLGEALALGCLAVVGEQAAWSADTLALARHAGLRTLAYTVNDLAQAKRLRSLGVDALITDRVDRFLPND